MRLGLVLLICYSFALVEVASFDESAKKSAKDVQQQQQQIELQTSPRSGDNKGRERRHIRVVTIELPPFMMKRGMEASIEFSNTTTDANATDIWYGYCMDFFLELVKHLPYDVTYEIRGVADRKFGSKRTEITEEKPPPRPASQQNSTLGEAGEQQAKLNFKRVESWNGMVGELEQQRAELALAPMAVMAERELVVDFTVPFYDLVGIQILLKRPEVPQNWFKFLTVLDIDVWLSIALAYFVTSFIIYIFDRLSPYSHKNQTRIKRMRDRRASRLNGAARMQEMQFRVAHLNSKLSNGINRKMPLSQASMVQHQTTSFGDERELIGKVEGFTTLGTLSSAAPNAVLPLQRSPLDAGELLKLSTNGGSAPNFRGATSTRRPSQDYLMSLRARLGALPHGDATQRDEEEEDDDDDDSELDNDGKPDFNLRDSLWFCITSLTPQGGGEAPQNLSGRVVAGAWWLFCFIVIASYTANLAAFLTVSRLDIPIESLDDLAKQYRIKYAPIDGTAEQTYFERMAYIEEIFYNIWKEMSLNESLSEEERSKFSVWDYPISDRYTKIWSQIQEVGMPQSIEAGLERVRASTLDDGFALLANANLIKYAVMTDCSLKAVGEEFSRKPIALAVAKGHTQLRDDISYAILQLINKRFMEVLREKWWTNNPARLQCDANDDSEGISIENIGGVFIIILAGILLSFLVWAIERFAYNTKLDVSRNLLEQQTRANLASGPAATTTTTTTTTKQNSKVTTATR